MKNKIPNFHYDIGKPFPNTIITIGKRQNGKTAFIKYLIEHHFDYYLELLNKIDKQGVKEYEED